MNSVNSGVGAVNEKVIYRGALSQKCGGSPNSSLWQPKSSGTLSPHTGLLQVRTEETLVHQGFWTMMCLFLFVNTHMCELQKLNKFAQETL